jgi:hypothetical protein
VTSDPRVFLTLDMGAATTAAALVGRLQSHWRLLGTIAMPATRDPEPMLELLVGRFRSAAPQIVEELDLPNDVSAIGRLVARSNPRAALAVLAASDARRDSLAAAADRAGWRVRGASLEHSNLLALVDAALDLTVEAALIGAADPPLGDERRRLDELRAVVETIAQRRPGLPLVLSGAVATAAGRASEASAETPSHSVKAVPPAERLFAPAPNAGEPAGAPLTTFLLGLRYRPDDPRQGIVRSTRSLAAVVDRRVEALEIGLDGGLRAAAWPSAQIASGVAFLSDESAAAALFPPEPDEATVDAVLAWSTLPMDRTRLRDRLGELRLRPWADAQGEGALLRLAAARVAVARLLAATPAISALPPADLVVATGGVWSSAPAPAIALALADVHRRSGASQIAVDHARLLGPLGTLDDDGERRQLLDDLLDEVLLPVGSVIVAQGLRTGRPIGHVAVRSDGRSQERELVPGGLEIVDVPPGQLASAEFDFREPVVVGTRGRRFGIEISGGLAGLVVDLRDVPLRLPERSERRRDQLAEWQRALWPDFEA